MYTMTLPRCPFKVARLATGRCLHALSPLRTCSLHSASRSPHFHNSTLSLQSLHHTTRHHQRLFSLVPCQRARSATFCHSWKLQLRPWTWCHMITRRVSQSSQKASTPSAVTSKAALPKGSDVLRLLSLARPERWRLAAAVSFLLVSSTVSLAVPFGIGKVIDIIYTEDSTDMVARLKTFCGYLLVVFVVGALANMCRVYLMNTSGQRIIKRMRERLFGSIIQQEMAFFDKMKTGELINRLSADTALVGQSVTMNISDGLRSIAQAIGGVGMMLYVSPKLCGIALSIVPPVMALTLVYGRYVRGLTRKVQDALADATQVAEERVANIRTVRAFGQEEREVSRYTERISQVLRLAHKEALASGAFWGLTGFSGNLIVLSVIYYGGLQMSESIITVGELSSFLMYAAYTGVSIGGLSSFYSDLMKGLGASTRVWDLLDRQPAIPLHTKTTPLPPGSLEQVEPLLSGSLTFRDVYFSYPSRPDVPVCAGLSLHVPQGSVMAVVGASGSGKSTLAALLLRYYDPQQGVVEMDGRDIREFNPTWLRQHMGLVSQEPTLFSCSIAENIAYSATDPDSVTLEEVEEAARQANALNFIHSFPRGMDTPVGERGVMLSGGQKQRIAIARAILKNPRILLLDEATSALDAESEHLVQEALERVMAGRTVVTIAHRLSTIRQANQIAVLHQGTIAELGSYEQLMADPEGRFRRLVERQTTFSNGV